MAFANFTLRSPMPASAQELYDWHAVPGAFLRLQPPWERVQVVDSQGQFGTDGFRLTIRAPLLGPIKSTWEADAFGFEPGKQFQDRAHKGPFAYWHHTHRMIADGPNASFLEDHIDYRLPLGALGRLFGSGLVRARLNAMFAYRHALTASDLRRHRLYRNQPRLKVAITGSRGLVGSQLVAFLLGGGHQIVRLATGKVESSPADGTTWVAWNPTAPLDPAVLDGCDAVIHLAGDNVAEGRWNAAKKRTILESRTIPTAHLARAIAALSADRRPKTFLCASAVGIYGSRGEEALTEDSAVGSGFFAEVGTAWEAAANPAREAGVRTCHARIGVVLTPTGAALGKQLAAFKAGAGAVLGSGKQWLPWITIGDVVGALHHALMNPTVSGAFNAVGPKPATNREFAKTLGRVLSRPAFFWLPGIALRVMFGEMANEALLASMKAYPTRLEANGFVFDHPDLEGALRFLLGR